MALNNPYVGPRPFRQDEQPYFFGRVQEAETLAGLVVARRASLLFAQSGVGKSSLLAAGVAPRLMHQVRTVRGRIVDQPLVRDFRIARVGLEVASKNAVNVFVSSVLHSLGPQAAFGADGDATLAQAVNELLKGLNASPSSLDSEEELPLVLVIDQFEELFTRHLAFREHRRGFFEQVRDAIQSHDALRVLFSMREDYLAELTPYVQFLPDELRSRYRLEHLKGQSALDAITMPARHVATSRPYAPGVAESLLANLVAKDIEYVEPLLLQVVCKRLWAGLPEERTNIFADDVKKYGDVDRALIDYYNDAVTAVVQGARTFAGNEISPRWVRRFFGEQLITPNSTRGLVYFDTTTGMTAGLPNKAIEVLTRTDINILRGEARGTGHWYELSHDRLILPIIASNAEWEKTNINLLCKRAQQWSQGGRRNEDLLSRVELHAEETRQRQNPDEPLTVLEKEFFERSKSFVSRAARAQRRNVEDLGWAVIFAEDDPDREAVRLALGELLDHRRKQTQTLFPVSEYLYRDGESAEQFLARSRGLITPGSGSDSMPHYLLLIGDPKCIPFEFQYGLNLQCAVGRLCFTAGSREENLLAYARYARSVVEAETSSWALPRRSVAFAPTHQFDQATKLTFKQLVHPMFRDLRGFGAGSVPWKVVGIVGDLATKDNLRRIVGGDRTPALLFVSSHGMQIPSSQADPSSQAEQQRAAAGAVVCADWTDPVPITSDFFFAADDISDEARVLGTITVLFNPYGGGTPRWWNQWTNQPGDEPRELAPRPFVSRLSERLLGHPRGSALAVVGHIDTIFTTCFAGREGTEGYKTFVSILARMMCGHTVGAATEVLSQRYKQVVSELLARMLEPGTQDLEARRNLMTEAADIRNWIVLGDPAVYLPVEGILTPEHPTVELDKERLNTIKELPAGEVGKGTKRGSTAIRPLTAEVATFNGIDLSTGAYFYEQAPLEGFLPMVLRLEQVETVGGATEDIEEIKATGEAFLSDSLESGEDEVD